MTTDFLFGLYLGSAGMLVLIAGIGFVRSVLAYRRLTIADTEQPFGDWPRDLRGRM